MKHFLSCDWSTSSFRLRLVKAGDYKIITEVVSAEGIAATYADWQQKTRSNEEQRLVFYLDVINKHIKQIEEKTNHSLSGVQIIISGMASSPMGFIDIPYSRLPVSLEGSNIHKVLIIPAKKDFDHKILVISGIKTDDDVIRGEETQLMGCVDTLAEKIGDELFIFPGAHSKHIRVVDNQIVAFNTYMTGEFFDLLSKKSVLRANLEGNDITDKPECLCSFKKGVNHALGSNLLNSVFKVRTNNLFNKLSKKENFSYLSGLLIASELKDLAGIKVGKINLLCGPDLKEYYLCALEVLGLLPLTEIFEPAWVNEAVVRGHHKIYKQAL
jgi:2-dehydro-3-deoxygalactonokinase